jgi:hypothetical protein
LTLLGNRDLHLCEDFPFRALSHFFDFRWTVSAALNSAILPCAEI